MPSPEFAPKLNWQEAQEYRRKEAHAIRNARNNGLRDEAREYHDLLHQDPIYQEAQILTWRHRWEHLAQKIPEFPQSTWEKAGRVLSGINNGVKAALFVDIAQNTKPGTYISTEDIVAHFKELFAGTQLLEAFGKNTKSQVIQYCQQSLCDVGLLAAKYSVAGKLIGFGVTEEGLTLGLPHTLRLLEWENATNLSAYAILGVAHSPTEVRAPFNYARMLEYLFRHPYNARAIDLVDAGVDKLTVSNALKSFYTVGLVDYKAVTPRTSRVPFEYAWDTNTDLGQAPYITNGHELQNEVIQIIQQKGLSAPVIRFSARDIIRQLPEEIRKRWKEKSLSVTISKIFSGLARDGFLQRVTGFKGGERLSDIALTRKGRSVVFRIILPVLLESSAQPLTTGLSQLTQTSAELYYPYSQSNKTREHQNNIQRLVQILQEGPQTAQDLATRVKLSTNRINKILRPHVKGSSEVILEVDGQPVTIERRKEKGVWYYSLKNPASLTLV